MASGSLLLGLDLGTSSLKAVLLEPDGRLLSSAGAEYPLHTPRPGWAEQDPDDWFAAVLSVVRSVLGEARAGPDSLAGIGLSGQMHGLVVLDGQGRPLRPAIIWADARSQEQVARARRRLGEDRLGRWTGNPLATGFMLPSWLWLREHEPEVASRTAQLLLPKDYLRYQLTGQLGSEPSDACSTALFDTLARRWSAPLLAEFEIHPDLLPPLGESAAVAGELARDPAEQLGLPPGLPVVYGGGDQACQALGHGVLDPGELSATIGTGGQLLAPLAAPLYDPQLRLHLYCHALPERWFAMAAILSAGLSLRWLRDNLLEGRSYADLADEAAAVPAGAEGLLFLPYLLGERTPHMDPQARGAFLGLALRHRRAHLVRAVMEGVVFALRQGLELMESLGVRAGRVIASGGATGHLLWLQLLADIFNRPIHCTATREAAALGAALLAGVGVGIYPDLPTACQRAVQPLPAAIHPDPERAAFYVAAYPRFRAAYPALKDLSPNSRTG